MATAAEISERLALYKAAEETILTTNQSYTIGKQTFTKANLTDIRIEIRNLEQQLALTSSGGKLSHATTVFGGRR